ncbi:beta-lactamase family protein [Streptomyces ferrugineus]|uniref:Beta-lactamase family protein n=1 Tax=Streptomyces ferrugineus TaxID=1413221 RepID=A0A7M2SCC5_9ACTN|nr:serine hydrolase domain-containing protein [Streptomyces ferrugineus]QOV33138.1 beta-lactamase family protein [Streptomyces ferrugineus]
MDVSEALDLALERGETGIHAAAYVGGELIVDVRAGTVADRAGAAAVDEATLFPIFSVTKAVTATAVHLQAERGLLDYDAPVAAYWPEYAANGKEAVTIRHVLTHRAGVPQMPLDITPDRLGDWDWIAGRLAEVKPWQAPGTANAYMPYSFGWILGEVVRRTDPVDRSFAEFVQQEICQPLGVENFWLGIPEGFEARVVELHSYDDLPMPEKGTLRYEAVPPLVPFTPATYNRPEVHQAVIPGAGGITDARSVARIFSLLANRGEVDGVRLLSEKRVLAWLEPSDDMGGYDATNGGPGNPTGVGGYALNVDPFMTPGGGGKRVLSQAGAGGSVGWADVDTGISIAICHNRMFVPFPTADPPFAPLGDALYEAAMAAR